MRRCFPSINVNPRTWLVKLGSARVNPKSVPNAGFVLPINLKLLSLVWVCVSLFFHALRELGDVLPAKPQLRFAMQNLLGRNPAIFPNDKIGLEIANKRAVELFSDD